GEYQFEYKVDGYCTDSDSTVVTIHIISSGLTAVADVVNGICPHIAQMDIANVMDNDVVSGIPVVQADYTISTETLDPEGIISVNADGNVDVAAGAQPGQTYTLEYRITENTTPTNFAIGTLNVTILVDDEDPTFVEALPTDVTVECDAIPDAETLTATDNCGDATVTFAEVSTDGACANSYTLTRTGTAEDLSGNTTIHTQTIAVEDTTAPTFVEALPADITVECDAVPTAETLTATDNCGDATVTFAEVRTDGTCANSYSLARTWTATDECGLTTSHTQTITVEDTTAPTFVEALPADVTVECDAVPTAETLTATDNCGAATVTFEETTTEGSCVGNYTLERTWTATDDCGNETVHTQTITVEDTTAPEFVGELPADATYVCAAEVPVMDVLTVTDNCDIGVIVETDEQRIDGDCPNRFTLTRTWTAIDACGNEVSHTQEITVEDTTAPALTGTPYAGQTGINACTADAVASAPFDAVLAAQGYTDGCGGAITVTLTDTELTGDDCNWTVTYTYSVTDACGNVLEGQTYTNIGGKQGKPVITTNPQHSWTECGSDNAMDDYYAWLNNNGGATAESACGNDVTWSYWLEDTNTIVGYAGTVTVNFKATDACGNSTIRQATFAFVDTTPPTITQDPTNLVIECSVYGEDELNAWLSNFGNAQAEDTCGQVTWSHNYQGNMEVCSGAINVTFTATDEAGLQSTVTATVEVVDTIAPTLTVVAQPLTVQCGANTDQALNNWLVNHGGAEAIDNCATVTWTNDYDPANFVAACGNTGSVEVTFTGSDSCGNTVTTMATFTIEDTAAPTLVTPAQPQTAECGADAEAALLAWLANNGGATATDSCDADLTWTNDYNDGANFIAACGNTGEVTVTFTAADDCGNSVSTVAKFTIVDTTKPVFDINPQNVEAECDGA